MDARRIFGDGVDGVTLIRGGIIRFGDVPRLTCHDEGRLLGITGAPSVDTPPSDVDGETEWLGGGCA